MNKEELVGYYFDTFIELSVALGEDTNSWGVEDWVESITSDEGSALIIGYLLGKGLFSEDVPELDDIGVIELIKKEYTKRYGEPI